MKRKGALGFTLIELLAVIVILAIIALIATPIVVNIINDSKKESQQRSIELYVDHAQKAITKYQMTHPDFNPKECTIEDKKLTCDGTPIEVEMKGQTPESGTVTFNNNNKIYYDLVLDGMEYVMDENGKKDPVVYVPQIPAPGEDYRGYYVDVDGNGTVDGVIYADLAQSKSGNWGPGENGNNASYGTYSYTAKTDLNEYTISNNKYSGKFGEKEIIKLKKDKDNPRFYVMALDDFVTGSFDAGNNACGDGCDYRVGTYYWYKNAYEKMSTYADDTKTDFGKGYENTGKIIGIWEKNGEGTGSYIGATKDDHDIWKHIQTKYQEGWYIPSRGEWGAFADYFEISSNYDTGSYIENSENYNSKYGLSEYCWSSSQYDTDRVWYARFGSGYMEKSYINSGFSVRLSTTF